MTEAMRIVSLLPSATEIVAALGMVDTLVGRSHECDWPVGLEHLPVLTSPKINSLTDAGTIDQNVRMLVEQGVSVYRLDAACIQTLAPDFVITQSQCELCAVSLSEVAQALRDWVDPLQNNVQMVVLKPMTLADVWTDIANVAKALRVETKGAQLIADLQQGFADLAAATAFTASVPRKTVFFMEWTTPLMGAGNWMPEVMRVAGGEVVLGRDGEYSSVVTWDDIAAADPDVVIVGPCGFDIARARIELAKIENETGWQGLRAVREGAVYLVNGNHYFNRPGPRLLDSAQIAMEILYGDIRPRIFDETAWIHYGS